jgi:hypothetical protein
MAMKIVLVILMNLWNVTTKEKGYSPKVNLEKEVNQLKTLTINQEGINPLKSKPYSLNQNHLSRNFEIVRKTKKKENKTKFINFSNQRVTIASNMKKKIKQLSLMMALVKFVVS